MDCKTARLLLDYDRPRAAELPAGDAAALEGHLTSCPDCDTLARGERQLDDHLGRAVRDVPLTEGIRDRLLERLMAERRTWYRRQARRGAGALATAAVVLLAIGLPLYWNRPQPPIPDGSQVALENPALSSSDQVDEWLWKFYPEHTGVALAPREFDGRSLDYSLLVFSDLARFQGEQVPRLLFLNGGTLAKIYVLSSRQFNLQQDPEDRNSPTILYRRCPDNANIMYVIVLSGDSLAPFLKGQPRPPA